MADRDLQSRIVIIGAGVFGLTTALELSQRGYSHVTVVDRGMPPVADGSSVDISRIIRFDYGDAVYTRLAKEAYDLWSSSPLYKPYFFPSPFLLASRNEQGRSYIRHCLDCLNKIGIPSEPLTQDILAGYGISPTAGGCGTSEFQGYCNQQAGWADAAEAIASLRDRCARANVSFITGQHGAVTGFRLEPKGNRIEAVHTQSQQDIAGDYFILAAGAWSGMLVDMYNSTLATAQVLGFMRLSDEEMQTYRHLPTYINFTTGVFSFPPHPREKLLKVAVHGWGYTRATHARHKQNPSSSPPTQHRASRANFAPVDGVKRLKQGLVEILPELASREFERVNVCWYTDTPTGDFIIDKHPEYANLHLATGGSGHAFKFLPVLGKLVVDGIECQLPQNLRQKWSFKTHYQNDADVFRGDGSRGGPQRREVSADERAKL